MLKRDIFFIYHFHFLVDVFLTFALTALRTKTVYVFCLNSHNTLGILQLSNMFDMKDVSIYMLLIKCLDFNL